MANVGIFDMKTGTVGQGSDIYGIPGLHSGSVIYFYRKDLFDAAGLKPATTWDEFKAAAMKLNSDEVAGCSFIGANDFSLADGRLVHPLHHHRRQADERQPEGEELQAQSSIRRKASARCRC